MPLGSPLVHSYTIAEIRQYARCHHYRKKRHDPSPFYLRGHDAKRDEKALIKVLRYQLYLVLLAFALISAATTANLKLIRFWGMIMWPQIHFVWRNGCKTL